MTAKKAEKGNEKTENLVLRITPKDKALLEKLAKRDDATVSQYVYGAIMVDFLMSGDAEAILYSASRVGNGIKRMLKERFLDSTKIADTSEQHA